MLSRFGTLIYSYSGFLGKTIACYLDELILQRVCWRFQKDWKIRLYETDVSLPRNNKTSPCSQVTLVDQMMEPAHRVHFCLYSLFIIVEFSVFLF